MEKYLYNMNNYALEDPDKESNNNNAINNYLTYSSKVNGPMYIGPGAQANLLKNLMNVLDILSKSKKQFDFIKNGFKFKSFEKYLKYLSTTDTKSKLKLIKHLYKALYNEKNPPELTGVLPADMVLKLNLRTLSEIRDYILFSLHCLYNTKNYEAKLTNLILGNMTWREACTKKNYVNSEELSKFEKAMNYLETLNCFSCYNLEFTQNLKEDQDIVFENILLFYLFYEALLKTCLKINIDMSMPKLNEFYSNIKIKNNLKSLNIDYIFKNINQTFIKGLLVNYIKKKMKKKILKRRKK